MLSRIQIRQFLAVVDRGSFTRAAQSLNVTQPSLSAGIGELERQLGTPLFVRERRRIRLTDAANLLLPLARAIEGGFHQVEAQVGLLPAPRRPIRLGVLETLPPRWLEAAVATHPAPDPLELIEGGERELHGFLAHGTLDLALTIVAPDETRFATRALLREPYLLAVAATHPLAGRGRVTAADVAGETMIARRACEVLGETSRFFTDRGVRPRFSLRSAHDHLAMAMVRAGLGVTVAPRSLAEEGIAMLELAEFEPVRTIGLAFGPHWPAQFGADHPLVAALAAAVYN